MGGRPRWGSGETWAWRRRPRWARGKGQAFVGDHAGLKGTLWCPLETTPVLREGSSLLFFTAAVSGGRVRSSLETTLVSRAGSSLPFFTTAVSGGRGKSSLETTLVSGQGFSLRWRPRWSRSDGRDRLPVGKRRHDGSGRTSWSVASEGCRAKLPGGTPASRPPESMDRPRRISDAARCGSPHFHAILAGWTCWGAAIDRSPPKDSIAAARAYGAHYPRPSPPRAPWRPIGRAVQWESGRARGPLLFPFSKVSAKKPGQRLRYP